MRNEKVEIFLGNHCINNDTLGRRQKQPGTTPTARTPSSIPEVWGKYLDEKRDALLEFMKDPKNN